jgi:hypothetical protein
MNEWPGLKTQTVSKLASSLNNTWKDKKRYTIPKLVTALSVSKISVSIHSAVDTLKNICA